MNFNTVKAIRSGQLGKRMVAIVLAWGFAAATTMGATVWYEYPPNASPVENLTDASVAPDILGVRLVSGTVQFRSGNTYSGGTEIQGGVCYTYGAPAHPFGSGPVSIQGGRLQAQGNVTVTNSITIDGNFHFGCGNASTPDDDITFTGPVELTGNRVITAYDGDGTDVDLFFQTGFGDGGNAYSVAVARDANATHSGSVWVDAASTYSGATIAHGAGIYFRAPLTTSSEVIATKGGTFGVRWTNAGNSNNRLGDSIPVTLRGGTFNAWADLGGYSSSYNDETVGTMTLDYGLSTVYVGAKRCRTRLTVNTLNRNGGGILYVYRRGTNHDSADGRLYITGQAQGFIGGWIYCRIDRNNVADDEDYDFGWYDDGTYGVWPMHDRETRVAQVNGAASTDHVKTTAAQNTLTGDTTIKSLAVTGAYNNDLGGNTLDIDSGGLLKIAGAYDMSNGSLTAGGGQIFLLNLADSMTVSANIVGSSLDVATRGAITLSGNNTFGGDLYVSAGTLTLSAANVAVDEVQVASGAILSLGSVSALPASATVHLLYDGEEYGKIDNSVGTVTVYDLTLDGVAQGEGTYGAVGTGADVESDDYFSGTGLLEVDQTIPSTPPTILNEAATNVTAASAFLNGHLLLAGTTPTTVQIYWGTEDGGIPGTTWEHTNTWAADYWAEGDHPYTNLTYPTPDRMYYYTYSATNAGGVSWPPAGTVQSLLGGNVTIAAQQNASEVGPVNGIFTISRDAAATNGELTVYYEVDESGPNAASNAIDFAALPGTVTLEEGVASTTIVVQVLLDYGALTSEADETLTLNLLTGTYGIAAPGTAQITITNDPAPPDTMYLQSDQNMQGGGSIAGFTAPVGGASISKGVTSGDGQQATPYLYEFGSGVDFEGNVNLQASKIYNDQADAFTLDMGGYDLTGDSGGTALSTYYTGLGGYKSDIKILNVGTVAIGLIDTHKTSYGAGCGDVQIGASGARADSVRVDSIAAHLPKDAGTRGHSGGSVRIYCNGDVRIATSGNTAGDVLTYALSSAEHGGAVTFRHDGTCVAAEIQTYADADGYDAGSVLLNGDYSGNGASGGCTVSNILTRTAIGTDVNSDPGAITITGYTNVLVTGYLNTENRSTGAGADSRPIDITNITGNIRIIGQVTCNAASGNANDSYLNMECSGRITVGALDLSKVLYAVFDADQKSWLVGALTGTDGAPATPATVADLRTPVGQSIYYDPSLPGNSGLNRQKIPLLAPNGIDPGGYLEPPPVQATVFLLR